MARVLISAAHKSSGKTTLSVGLAAALAARGLAVQTFKKEPEYRSDVARSCERQALLQSRLQYDTDAEILECVATRGAAADFALIESNKGLHDEVDLEGRD